MRVFSFARLAGGLKTIPKLHSRASAPAEARGSDSFWRGLGVVVCLAVGFSAGCAVGQKPGQGQVLYRVEPRTNGGYYLYLPDGYDQALQAGRFLPLVMTFHGMKPFDSAAAQIREWQQEADRYSYVVCAPKLLAPDLFGPLPLDRVTGSLQRDEERILAIMDELGRTANVDPNHVLATSWSYGGYVAHYMANRHPERFSCLAVKQSNFSAEILDPAQVPRYRDRKVGIFYTQNDFKVCRTESQAAAQWYSRHGFDLTFAVFQDLGHERRPGIAASFFARTCNATPRTPPVELAGMQILELPPGEAEPVAVTQVAETPTAGPLPGSQATPRTTGEPSPGESALAIARGSAGNTGTGGGGLQPTQAATTEGGRSKPLRTRPVAPPARKPRATHPPSNTGRPEPASDNPIRVRVSSTIGISPLLVSYSVAPLPADLGDEAYFLWTDNGEPMSNAVNGQKLFSAAGGHRLEVLITTSDGREFRAGETVTVLTPMGKPDVGP